MSKMRQIEDGRSVNESVREATASNPIPRDMPAMSLFATDHTIYSESIVSWTPPRKKMRVAFLPGALQVSQEHCKYRRGYGNGTPQPRSTINVSELSFF